MNNEISPTATAATAAQEAAAASAEAIPTIRTIPTIPGTTFPAAIIIMMIVGVASAQDRISSTVHNLSVSGPGTIQAVSEQQVCIFCHAPHNTSGVRPLWNREFSISNYQIYGSSTLNAQPGQPTGASKLCLSCHDGTIALGAVLSKSDRIRMNGGDFLPSGMSNLGTDLSDDHPVSFFFTSGIAASDGQLVDPSMLPPEIKLDASGQLQCTACHDPHHNLNGDFLVKSNEFSGLCTSCHKRNGWQSSAHQSANTSVAGVTTAGWPYGTVAQNACRSCHRPHTAGTHQRLLIFQKEEDNCLVCHNGLVATKNIQNELDKLSAHDPRIYQSIHDAAESPYVQDVHVQCVDCHNPHAVQSQVPNPGTYIPIGATMTDVRGVVGGSSGIAQNEYDVCFRCHADSAVPIQGQIVRLAHTNNLRLKFAPGNPSFHPVVSSATGSDTVSLVPELSPGTLIRCTDCHNNDTGPGAGGGGPNGPHGSNYSFLLERNYSVRDDTIESELEYSLCYKCHRRSSILNDESFKEHKKHIRGENSPCSACHDPHGISRTVGGASDHTHLINFDTTIVRPEPQSGRIEFKDNGRFAGSCTLVCHGENHRDKSYGG